ncbi:Cytidylate kinase [Buchnera aphidicola (Eriosoma lanigerum)]|uniref:(d)CMP kinase n=1 Tax=Buchnera aphidicola TaxID=9 RepID=UPI0034647EB2
MNTIPVITIDGPSAAGKSTLCNKIASILKWSVLESGILYRVLAFITIKNRIPISEKNIIFFAKQLNFNLVQKFNKTLIFLNGKNISNDIISTEISHIASRLAVFPNIRTVLLNKQRCFRKLPGLVANGRDMGTIVFPDACIKFFLYANLNIRVKRRMKELKRSGFKVSFNQLLLEIKKRDNLDSNRKLSPLIPATNAIMLNSTNISITEIVNLSMQYIRKIIFIK